MLAPFERFLVSNKAAAFTFLNGKCYSINKNHRTKFSDMSKYGEINLSVSTYDNSKNYISPTFGFSRTI